MPTSAVQSLKLTLIQATGLSRDALHIYFGLAALLFTALILRKRLTSSWVPWGVVFIIAVACEVSDMRDDLRTLGHWRWSASVHDLINTLVWPTVIVIFARWTSVFQSLDKDV